MPRSWLRPSALKAVRELQFRSPLRRYFFPRYSYNFTPSQLCFLCAGLSATKSVEGAILEVGCAQGATTVFLNKHLTSENINKSYIAIDTFTGFVEDDIDFEVSSRGKVADMYDGFRLNSRRWFDATMELNGIRGVRSIQADVNTFDLTSLGPISFALLDVDLYRPMAKALPEIWASLSPGGVIVVDDCDPSEPRFDGSHQAYAELIEAEGLPVEIANGKLGVLRKPKSAAR